MENRKSRGVFYTPEKFVKHIVKDLRPDETIIDPSMGSGAFLVGAAKHFQTILDQNSFVKYLNECIYGIDLNPESVEAGFRALAELAPGQDLSGLRSHLWVGDSVWTFDWTGKQFDVVIGNPPWAQLITRPGSTPEENARIKAFAKYLLDEHHKPNGEFKRSLDCQLINLFDVFIQKAVKLARKEIRFVVPKTFMGNAQQAVTRRIMYESFPVHSIHTFSKKETTNIFPEVSGTACLLFVARRGPRPETVALALDSTLETLDGPKALVPYSYIKAPYYAFPTLGTKDTELFLKMSKYPKTLDDYIDKCITGYKPSAKFKEHLLTEEREGYLPYWKGANITGPRTLGGPIKYWYDPEQVGASIEAWRNQRRIAMKHVSSATDKLRTFAVVFEPGMLGDDSIYFYTLKNPEDEEHVLNTLNSQESDTWLRWFTENNLSQFAVRAIPCHYTNEVAPS
jgi:N-6 DNA Methylase